MAATPHRIQILPDDPTFAPLPMGGTNPQGVEITANQRFLTLAGLPWIPVMGEFHFSRYPRDRWEEELLKMKAGGISVVATYIFWIHIEEIEGQFDWDGSRDLHAFIQLCARHGLYAYPRIGPWAHGECRNGGFPDWLVQAYGPDLRTDSPRYLAFVHRFYREISQQLQGLLWKDGGPVIGIQIENELLNNGAHIRTLLHMARDLGLDVPIYTMTGWGPAEVPPGDEIIPVFGGYPDAFWDRQTADWSRNSRKHYFFSNLRDDNTIGADLNKNFAAGDLSHLEHFPFGTCETGGGMQAAYHRRPVIQPEDVTALAAVKVGCGSNLQGYYMYHGGANPEGKLSTLQESQATGYWNDLPVINYDFQAPLGQYGQVRPSYHALRLLHSFLNDFGDRLAPLPMTLPIETPASLDDRERLRWAVRSNGEQGYLFINNYQRIESLPAHPDTQFQVELPSETLTIPAAPITIPEGMHAIWPLNFDLDGTQLKYATAQPVCRLNVEGISTYVFASSAGVETEWVFESSSLREIRCSGAIQQGPEQTRVRALRPGLDCRISLTTAEGRRVDILLLSSQQALELWKGEAWGQEGLFIANAGLYFDTQGLHVQQNPSLPLSLAVYPPPGCPLVVDGAELSAKPDGLFTRYTLALANPTVPISARLVQPAAQTLPVALGSQGVAQAPDDAAFTGAETWQVEIPSNAGDGANEVLLIVDYTGDAARALLGNHLIDDHFNYGHPWEIGLSRFAPEVFEQGLTLRFLPLRKDAPIYLPPESWPDFGNQEERVQVKSITARRIVDLLVTCA